MITLEIRDHWIKTSYRDAENRNEIMLTLSKYMWLVGNNDFLDEKNGKKLF